MQIAAQQNPSLFIGALRQGVITAIITFFLFVLIVGFRADLNLSNVMELTPQLGYLFNYVIIAGVGRFTWYYFGGGKRGTILALFPSIAIFIAYRAWLYYQQYHMDPSYDGAMQLTQLTIVGVILVALLIVSCIFLFSHKAVNETSQVFQHVSTRLAPFKKLLPIIILALVLFYPIMIINLYGMRMSQKWIDNYAIQVMIYIMLAWGLNIVVGFAGLLDLGYVAFYAVGAYSVATIYPLLVPILGDNYIGWAFWVILPIAGLLAGLWGIMLGFPVLRLRGDYLAIVTLAFGEIIKTVLQNWTPVTGGAQGLNVEKATLFGISFERRADNNFAELFDLTYQAAHYKIFLYYFIVVLLVITAMVVMRLRKLPIGRAWEALREDEIACRSLGINLVTTKLSAFAIGAMFGGFAGAFFAARQGRVDYTSFTFMESAMVLAIVVLGGMGSLTGIAIAAIVMIGGMDVLREVPGLQMLFGPEFQDPAQYRMLWFGLAMVFVMILRPRGLIGGRMPSVFLHERKAISDEFTKEGHG